MFEDQIRSNINRTWGLILFFIVFFTAFIYAIGIVAGAYYGDPSVATIFLVCALLFSILSSWFSYYNSDKLVISSVGAKPADPFQHKQLLDVLEGLAIASGNPTPPKAYVMNDPSPNAFATGRDPQHAAIVVTSGLLEMMDKQELEGVLAHEMSHVLNYDILLATIISVLVGTVIIVSHFFFRWMWYGGGGGRRSDSSSGGSGAFFLFTLAFAIIFAILAPIAAQIIQLAVSRKREFLADASAVRLTRLPDGLASALEKIGNSNIPVAHASKATAHMFIDEPFKKPKRESWLTVMFSTHPPIAERITRLRSM
jgi:heat shock protein HtpX